jgi:hypothetical protein
MMEDYYNEADVDRLTEELRARVVELERTLRQQAEASASILNKKQEQLTAAQRECEDQARLNGIGASREAALQAQLAAIQTREKQLLAKAVVDRWETPLWKDAPATATFIYALRNAMKGETK